MRAHRPAVLGPVLLASIMVTSALVVHGQLDAAYPGANGRIAFFGNSSTAGVGVFTMNADGSDVKLLAAGGRHPSWSPDGTKVAYTVQQDLFVVQVEASGAPVGEPINLTNVTNASVLRQNASWSPDSTKLVFERLGDSNKFDIWVGEPNVNFEAGTGTLDNEMRLTDNRADERRPAWSPLGDRIAFTSDRDGDPEVYTMSAEGEILLPGETTQITFNSVADVRADWSPDGAQLLYTKTQPGKGKSAVNTDVYRYRSRTALDGDRHRRRLQDLVAGRRILFDHLGGRTTHRVDRPPVALLELDEETLVLQLARRGRDLVAGDVRDGAERFAGHPWLAEPARSEQHEHAEQDTQRHAEARSYCSTARRSAVAVVFGCAPHVLTPKACVETANHTPWQNTGSCPLRFTPDRMYPRAPAMSFTVNRSVDVSDNCAISNATNRFAPRSDENSCASAVT